MLLSRHYLPPLLQISVNQRITIRSGSFFDRFKYRSPRRHTLWLPYIVAPLLFDTRIYTPDFIRLRRAGELEEVMRKGRRIVIESCHEWGDYYSALSRNFIPQPDILTAVDNYVEKYFTRHTIGVHIRRTDNILAIQRSPLSLFIDAMQREIDGCSDVNFYVATDDEPTKAELRKIFGNRILTLQTVNSRNSVEGMKDAVKEMWLLSRTAKIYGCYYSSYAEIASKLTNIPLVILEQ